MSTQCEEGQPYENTDVYLWRRTQAPTAQYLAVHGVNDQSISIEVGGSIITKSIINWHALAALCEELAEALEKCKRGHYHCEDSWYSCPLSEEGCSDDSKTECDCGAPAHNAAIDLLLTKYRELK